MKLSLVKKLCCPVDQGDLDVKIITQRTHDEDEAEILEALLICKTCRRYFPVIYGIPIMTPDEYRDHTLEKPLLKRWGVRLQEGDPDNRAPTLLDFNP